MRTHPAAKIGGMIRARQLMTVLNSFQTPEVSTVACVFVATKLACTFLYQSCLAGLSLAARLPRRTMTGRRSAIDEYDFEGGG